MYRKSKQKRYKELPNGNFRTKSITTQTLQKKINKQMKTFIVWAQKLIGDERGNSELEDKSIEIVKSKE